MNLNSTLWVIQVVLAILFLMTGTLKAFQPERAKARLHSLKEMATGLVTFIGISELLGSAGLVLPWLTGILPWLTPVAAAGLALVMPLATGVHLRRREIAGGISALILCGLAIVVFYGRWVVG